MCSHIRRSANQTTALPLRRCTWSRTLRLHAGWIVVYQPALTDQEELPPSVLTAILSRSSLRRKSAALATAGSSRRIVRTACRRRVIGYSFLKHRRLVSMQFPGGAAGRRGRSRRRPPMRRRSVGGRRATTRRRSAGRRWRGWSAPPASASDRARAPGRARREMALSNER